MLNQAKQFLDTLFAAKEPGEFILIWLLDGRRSTWFTDTATAAAFVEANRSRDVYVGVALSPKDHGPSLRLKVEGGERMPSSIVALWADIDIGDGVHTKKNLPPTADDARTVLFPEFPPSMVLHSGGGLQCWWLFKEPWTLESQEEVRKAGALATRWIRAIRARAAAKGWDIDSVGDLPRVLRVPGTSNCKIPGQPRPVDLLETSNRQYNPSELDEYLDMIGAERVNANAPVVSSGEKLQYSTDAEPPFQRFQVFCDAEPKFKLSWDHLRKDMKDQSPSAYDMALANLAVQGGWTDQEIANLLIAHRRRYKEDLKLRDSYYAKTIAKARAAFVGADVTRELENLVTPEPAQTHDADGEHVAAGPSREDPPQKILSLVDRINAKLELDDAWKIIRIKRYMSEPAEYELQMKSGDIRLGGIENLVEWRSLYMHVLDISGQVIPFFKKNEWPPIAKALRQACVDVHAGEEGTSAGSVNTWLCAYLTSLEILPSFDESDRTKSPFMQDGRIRVYGPEFRKWVQINYGDRVTAKEMGIRLRIAGAEPSRVTSGKTTRQVWALSESFVPPAKSPRQSKLPPPEWVTKEEEQERVN